MPDKGYVISGMGVKEIDSVAQSMCWLVRLDSMGCLIPGCDETPIYNYVSAAETIFNIYPNPIINSSTVEIKIPISFQIVSGAKLSLNLYNLEGKLVDRYSNIPVNNPDEVIRFNIYKKNLATGIYEAELNYDGNILGAIKIVVE